MKIKKIYASQIAALDSNVSTGGGTDDTAAIQAVLDEAKDDNIGIHLIMDGAALISGLLVYSDTTIECINSDCGFYLKDFSDDAIIKNGNLSTGEIKDKNITLKGGSYNQNCLNQNRLLPEDKIFPQGENCSKSVTVFKFFGVEDFTMDSVTIIDQKTYACIMGNWKNVVMNNINIPLPHEVPGTNQDGLHFHSPGEFLKITNCRGRTGDDFIALNTDEGNGENSITDVIIDGVYLENSDQAIRILCWNKGRIDRVSIKNVSGKFKSFGFFIQPFFPGPCGSFGNITIENVDLEQTEHIYPYMNPFLFHIGGKIDSITLKNINVRYNHKDFNVISVAEAFSPGYQTDIPDVTYVKNLTVKDLKIWDERDDHDSSKYIRINRRLGKFVLENAHAQRSVPNKLKFVNIDDGGEIEEFYSVMSDE